MDAALDWLEIKKLEISYEACSQYRNALFRLEHYLLLGISKVLSAVRKTVFLQVRNVGILFPSDI